MKMRSKFNFGVLLLLLVAFFLGSFAFLPESTNAQGGDSRVEIFLSPRSGSFVEGSTFDVPVFINTNSMSVNEINLKINFDKNKLSVVKPSGGKSIIGFWTESPSYDNTKGILTYEGSIEGGIVTESGLISVMTFKVLNYGKATINIDSTSKVLLNDGLQTSATLLLGRAEYDLLKKMSEGVTIFSETHPSQATWYTNNNPILSWQRDVGVTGFSFVLDNKPFTVPDNIVDSDETTKFFENLSDGLWYFHIKAMKNGAWGNTGHFFVKIDTIPPAPFLPQMNTFSASAILVGRTLVSFFTTDNLSGLDHYEVGIINKNQPISEAPVFIETESPFQVPVFKDTTLKVIVRAFDKAGNIREGYIEVTPPLFITKFTDNKVLILLSVFILLGLIYFLINRRKKFKGQDKNFSVIEDEIENYLHQKNADNQRNILEKEKIENLEKNLEEVRAKIAKEIVEQ